MYPLYILHSRETVSASTIILLDPVSESISTARLATRSDCFMQGSRVPGPCPRVDRISTELLSAGKMKLDVWTSMCIRSKLGGTGWGNGSIGSRLPSVFLCSNAQWPGFDLVFREVSLVIVTYAGTRWIVRPFADT
jgi:hypothetical protein